MTQIPHLNTKDDPTWHSKSAETVESYPMRSQAPTQGRCPMQGRQAFCDLNLYGSSCRILKSLCNPDVPLGSQMVAPVWTLPCEFEGKRQIFLGLSTAGMESWKFGGCIFGFQRFPMPGHLTSRKVGSFERDAREKEEL